MEEGAGCECSSTMWIKCMVFGTWPLGGSRTFCFLSGSQQRVVEGLPNLLHDFTILCGFLFPFGKYVSHPMSHTLNLSKTLQYFPGFEKNWSVTEFPTLDESVEEVALAETTCISSTNKHPACVSQKAHEEDHKCVNKHLSHRGGSHRWLPRSRPEWHKECKCEGHMEA